MREGRGPTDRPIHGFGLISTSAIRHPIMPKDNSSFSKMVVSSRRTAGGKTAPVDAVVKDTNTNETVQLAQVEK